MHDPRKRWGLLVPLALLGLGACVDDSGYPKVATRELEEIEAPDYPEPPPVVAGLAQEAAAPIVAVNLPAGVTQEMVNQGQELYGTVCSACHGPAGGGSPVAPPLNDPEWLNITGEYEQILTIIHTGVAVPREYPGGMPALGGGNFSDEQVRAIGAYVYALSRQEEA